VRVRARVNICLENILIYRPYYFQNYIKL